ncbi:polysaccharide pyruvyl transferase family protein [Bacteroides pyogenes]|uniref:polysaccharide pyruvyl transferase family protein n=1 Tax=Bacteroides pyogenes TaxID=310300 RepID=UPI001BA7C79B|nr:polysaccharide pyruvyl transferase family protein [Bacteroides pyogenes]MBR8709111.1 hypothetical protein [Bacteroides pyogenes]MBR8717970.1 hypothetical protein [Bacteroides pyogenes]MBR8747415.1 hypothetical protein [Bacteroides pyogenes]MBR8757756.1 hypothetical protein [Bacteroides pyogenes]MBR8780984.1 hypothetical protein [Bacteroides pyogenes]
MKKIGVLTFHRAVNYGAVLQSYALVTACNSHCHVICDIIDYRSKFIEDYYRTSCLFLPKNWKRLVSYIIFNGNIFPNRTRLVSFLYRHNCILSDTPVFSKDLKKYSSNYDRIIVGSDQVWSPLAAGFDENYFLSFVEEPNKKCSYAASIGVPELPSNLTSIYRDRLRNFNNYSVREDSAKRLIENVIEKNVTVDIDPTLLLSKEEWKNSIDLHNIRPSIKRLDNYLLIYCISERKEIFEIADIMGKMKHKEIIYINDRWRPKKHVDNIKNCNIDEWLFLFMNASIIITDSFHGTAFSLNFEKQFVTFQSVSNKRSTRISSLLKAVDLEQRIVHDSTSVECIENIDYLLPRKSLELLRNRSVLNLNTIVNE